MYIDAPSLPILEVITIDLDLLYNLYPVYHAIIPSIVVLVGSIVEIIVTEDNVVNGIFFQDEEMWHMYDRFPEMLLNFVDATYKLNDLRMPLYLFLVEDGNGESEIVAVWMVVTEDATSIRQMAEIFKKHNRRWSDMQSQSWLINILLRETLLKQSS